MSVLCDTEIQILVETAGVVTPYDLDKVQPASYDLSLGGSVRRYWESSPVIPQDHLIIDPVDGSGPSMLDREEIPEMGVLLPSGGFMLAATKERFSIPNGIAGRLEGKSSIARLGLFIHITAGYFDPGFEGYATLELFNAAPHPIRLRAGMPIAQMSFTRMSGLSAQPYGSTGRGSHYQGQGPDPTESRLSQEGS